MKFVPKVDGSKETYGICDPSKSEILIRSGQSGDDRLKTFFHEICHALEDAYQIEIPHDQVYRWEVAWSEFFVSNWFSIAQLIVQPD